MSESRSAKVNRRCRSLRR